MYVCAPGESEDHALVEDGLVGLVTVQNGRKEMLKENEKGEGRKRGVAYSEPPHKGHPWCEDTPLSRPLCGVPNALF